MRILDIGSGRGGGLAFLSKFYEPELAIGIDYSSHQVMFARSRHEDLDNLFFSYGDAENL